jgi:hypothetical protein
MKANLDRKDLINLVKGIYPYYKIKEHPLIKKLGYYTGNKDEWAWKVNELSKLTEIELFHVYKTCKESWKLKGKSGIYAQIENSNKSYYEQFTKKEQEKFLTKIFKRIYD